MNQHNPMGYNIVSQPICQPTKAYECLVTSNQETSFVEHVSSVVEITDFADVNDIPA